MCVYFISLLTIQLGEEPERATSPSLTVPFWNQVLRRNGFTGLDYEVRDCEDDDFYSFSVMMSTAEPKTPVYDLDVQLVYGNQPPPDDWLQELKADLSAITRATTEIASLDCANVQGKTCVYLGDLEQPALVDIHASQFSALQSMATSCDNLLWVTKGGAIESENPDASLAHGMLRTLRHEYRGKLLVTLDVDPQRQSWSSETATSIRDVFSRVFDTSLDSSIRDWEYAERRGVISVPRLLLDKDLNCYVAHGESSVAERTTETLPSPDNSLQPHTTDSAIVQPQVDIECKTPSDPESVAENGIAVPKQAAAPQIPGVSDTPVRNTSVKGSEKAGETDSVPVSFNLPFK